MNGLNRSKKLLPQSIPSSPSRTDVHFHHLTAAISLLLLLLSATTQIVEPILFRNSGTQVKCFCDKGHCPGALTCTGKWCLIGVRNSDGHGKLDQECGNEGDERPMDCAQQWNAWSEVCVCEENFCNTFAYLRGNIDRRNAALRERERAGSSSSEADMLFYAGRSRGQESPSSNNNNNYRRPFDGEQQHQEGGDNDQQRQQLLVGGGGDGGEHVESTVAIGPLNIARHSGTLILLLVIVPLAAGGFSMCLIFLNYHCKML